MQRIKSLILSVLLIAAVFSGTTAQAAAATDLPAGMLIGDQDGIRVTPEGEYFINVDEIEAGDVITKRLTIRNTESYSYKVTMTAEPLEEIGPLKLLDEVHCTLAVDGRVLYDGRVRGNDGVNMIENALDLGDYTSGQQRELMITLTANPEMQKFYWTASESLFKWNFFAAQDITEKGPDTGDIIKNSLYVILPGVLLTMGILLLTKKRKEEKKAYGGENIAS